MSAAAGGAAAAGAAAAAEAEARRKREEEEEMTQYRRDELEQDWEFKIVRSTNKAFKDPALFDRVLEEESRAGWVLVEKFDDARLRFKRRTGERRSTYDLEFDPYRTHVGPTEEQQAMTVLGVIIGAVLAVAAVVLLLTQVLG